jgi:copper chaperone
MKKIQFKTNIMCNGCMEKVTPQLNYTEGIENWSVDLQNPNKILTIEGSNTNEEEVIAAVKKVGFQIERV